MQRMIENIIQVMKFSSTLHCIMEHRERERDRGREGTYVGRVGGGLDGGWKRGSEPSSVKSSLFDPPSLSLLPLLRVLYICPPSFPLMSLAYIPNLCFISLTCSHALHVRSHIICRNRIQEHKQREGALPYPYPTEAVK